MKLKSDSVLVKNGLFNKRKKNLTDSKIQMVYYQPNKTLSAHQMSGVCSKSWYNRVTVLGAFILANTCQFSEGLTVCTHLGN